MPKIRFSFWQFLCCGYLTFGRSFAYLGVPPLFIGEFFIAYYIYKNRNNWLNRLFADLFQFRMLNTAVALTLMWGIFELLRTVYFGQLPATDGIKTFAFNYYPLCLPIGIALGRDVTLEQFLRFFKTLTVCFGLYCILYIPFFEQHWELPWAPGVWLINEPAIPPLVPCGLLVLWPYYKDWKWRVPWLIITASPILSTPGRSQLLSTIMSLFIVSLSSFERVMKVFVWLIVMYIAGAVITAAVPGLEDIGKDFNPTVGFARVYATVNAEGAAKMVKEAGMPEEADEMSIAKGTAEWRKNTWKNILNSLDTTELQLIGHGHGADMGKMTADGMEIRSPHNFVMYAIFYTGAIGVATFITLLASMFFTALKIADPQIRTLAISTILATCVLAAVGNMFETPISAIPFYVFSGICCGMRLQPRRAATVGFQPVLYGAAPGYGTAYPMPMPDMNGGYMPPGVMPSPTGARYVAPAYAPSPYAPDFAPAAAPRRR